MNNKADISLMGYLPPYYHENEEIVHITNSENPEVVMLWDVMECVRRNQFILDADEFRIKQWEKLLRIKPDHLLQDLDFRKAVVIFRLSTRLPFTYRWLNEKLLSIVGRRHYKVYLNFDKYWLVIKLTGDVLDFMAEIKSYFREKIPANLGLDVAELFETWGDVLNRDYLTWGKVLSTETWGSRLSLTWGQASKMTVREFLKPNTWKDIKTYIWQEDE